MKRAAVSQLKASLSEFLGRVKAGEEVIVTERGKPIARLVPIGPAHSAPVALLELQKQGLLRLG
ncbi:MAG: type II toxin-antitoxin system prevent-host-death family antitoxin, partial [Candidatus Riflebacteria bacterium]|nr:type II toxin-antitoxin system prevent-host-death family antitoxin [Candidatus Riflebacteria bacterium]